MFTLKVVFCQEGYFWWPILDDTSTPVQSSKTEGITPEQLTAYLGKEQMFVWFGPGSYRKEKRKNLICSSKMRQTILWYVCCFFFFGGGRGWVVSAASGCWPELAKLSQLPLRSMLYVDNVVGSSLAVGGQYRPPLAAGKVRKEQRSKQQELIAHIHRPYSSLTLRISNAGIIFPFKTILVSSGCSIHVDICRL